MHRNKKPDHTNTDAAGEKIDKKHLPRLSQSVKNTSEKTGDIQQWAQPRKFTNKGSGECIVEKTVSNPVTGA